MQKSSLIILLSFAAMMFIPHSMPAMAESPNNSTPTDTTFRKVDVLPAFRGGDLMTFRSWANSKIIYPEKLRLRVIEGKVIVTFVVDKKGKVRDIEVIQSSHDAFSNEVVRVLKRSPKWTPGILDDEPAPVKFTLPIEFLLR